MASEFGLIGIGVMGRNLALNFLDHNISLATYDINQDNLDLLEEMNNSDNLYSTTDISKFISNLQTPRKIMLMVTAGSIVDQVIDDLLPYLTTGDIIIDGGNSNFHDTERRIRKLNKDNIFYLGVGISGGASGARSGPSMMPGGNKQAWELSKTYLQKIAAVTDEGVPCCQYLGSGGVGHFVKTIHNGIEYADMQLISEAYDILARLTNTPNKEIATIFSGWNTGRLSSYLIEITSKIFETSDELTDKYLIDLILDSASQKGTGKWSAIESLSLGSPATVISTAVFQRFISSLKLEREELSKIYPTLQAENINTSLMDQIESSLFIAKFISYVQGFNVLIQASSEYNWGLDLKVVAQVWSEGCIIRSDLLRQIEGIFNRSKITNLLKAKQFSNILNDEIHNLREVCKLGIDNGIPLPGFQNALSYFDSYRAARLPANLIQAQRDYFGSHGFSRIDQPDDKKFHGKWVH